MSIKIESLYCKHWLTETSIIIACEYPRYFLHPHDIVDLRDSIHYKSLQSNNYKLYDRYVKETQQTEHSLVNFTDLVNNFDETKMDPIRATYVWSVGKYVITDGVHRASILLAKNRHIKFSQIKLTYDEQTLENVSKLLLSTTNYVVCTGWNNRIPYHTIKLGDKKIQGQRDPERRLSKITPYIKLDNKYVVDIGCNIGGNFFSLPRLGRGIGFDGDSRCIEVAKNLKQIYQYNYPLDFVVHDFDKDSLEILAQKIESPDVFILTSMGSWVIKWKELYTLCASYKVPIIFETNNNQEGKSQLEFFMDNFDIKMISDNSDDDSTGNFGRKLYMITPKEKTMKHKVCIVDKYHHKNLFSLQKSIQFLDWELTSFEDASIVFSAHTYFDISKHPNKKFIFGPHFSVFPNDVVRQFDNRHNNAIYIQPSQQSIDSWRGEFKFDNIPMKVYPFGVDTERFKPVKDKKDNVLVYFKNRDPLEYKFLTDFLNKKNVNFTVIEYGKYKEQDYLQCLHNAKYIIWLGRHESQGYALEEALSSNVPILVWNVTLRVQEYTMRNDYANVKSRVTTIPYWDERCGEYFYDKEELEKTFDTFIEKLGTYKPREYILDNLTLEKRALELDKLVKAFFI